MKRLITEIELRGYANDNKQIILSPDCVLTPSAKDLAKELGVDIVWQGSVSQMFCPKQEVKKVTASKDAADINAVELKEVITKILTEKLAPACPNPVVSHVKRDQVKIEPFAQAPPGQRVGMTDVITSREANLGAGFMTFEQSSMPWNLTYDEIDYVLEGDFVVTVGNHEYHCKPGDVFSIPKGTKVVFGSPTKTKVFYVTYPANWAEL